MPAIGFIVGGKEYSYAEADRLARTTGFFEGFPPGALKALTNTREDGGRWLSPSAAGGCHRQSVLRARYAYYQGLASEWPSGVGTAIHGWIERSSRNSDWLATELRVNLQLSVTLRDGTTVPFMLQGTADCYDIDTGTGWDYKTVSDFDYWHRGRREWVQRDLPSESHIIQAQLYKLLLESNQMPVNTYWLWYVRTNKDAERRPFQIGLWDNEDIYQIACELAEPLAWYAHTGELPQNTYDYKNSICKTCPVKGICRELAKEGK